MHVKCKCWEESVFHMEDIGKSKNKNSVFLPPKTVVPHAAFPPTDGFNITIQPSLQQSL